MLLPVSSADSVSHLSAQPAIAPGYFCHHSGSVIPATSVILITHVWFSYVIQIVYTNKQKTTAVAINGISSGNLKEDRNLCFNVYHLCPKFLFQSHNCKYQWNST